MKLFGLTGGVGMGKSACAELLRKRNIPVIDTDELARQVVAPGQPAFAEIQRVFGPEILDAEGALRRDLLARKVFSDANARRSLEGILHPPIRRLWQAEAQKWRNENAFPLGVVMIPLLFETKAESEFDATLCVACKAATQFERLRARGWDEQQVRQRVAAQWPIDDKIAHATYVIWSEGPIEIHAEQLDRILRSRVVHV